MAVPLPARPKLTPPDPVESETLVDAIVWLALPPGGLTAVQPMLTESLVVALPQAAQNGSQTAPFEDLFVVDADSHWSGRRGVLIVTT
jgi:hypothetical protein